MRPDLRIPPAPDRLCAAGCSPEAIVARERFVRGAAEAWTRVGDRDTADRLSSAADALANRFQETCAR